jgi:hypothetical protein
MILTRLKGVRHHLTDLTGFTGRAEPTTFWIIQGMKTAKHLSATPAQYLLRTLSRKLLDGVSSIPDSLFAVHEKHHDGGILQNGNQIRLFSQEHFLRSLAFKDLIF